MMKSSSQEGNIYFPWETTQQLYCFEKSIYIKHPEAFCNNIFVILLMYMYIESNKHHHSTMTISLPTFAPVSCRDSGIALVYTCTPKVTER